MIQKMQKTVGILHVQHIDKVIEVPRAQLIDEAVEVPEIMQRHDPMIQEVENAQKTWSTKPKRSSRSSADTGNSERKELYREVHKSDTQDTASHFHTWQQSVRCTRMRDVSQTQCKDAESSERQSTSKSGAKCKDKTREKES